MALIRGVIDPDAALGQDVATQVRVFAAVTYPAKVAP